MRRFVLAGSAVLFLAAGASAAPTPGDPPVERPAVDQKTEFDAVKAEYDKANKDFTAAYRAAKTDEERQAAAATRPNPDEYAPRFAEIASKDAKSDVAAKCHAWIAVNARDAEMQAAGLDELMTNHLASPVIGGVCQSVLYSSAKNRDAFLEAVLAKSSDHEAQGRACYALAFGHARRGEQRAAEPLFERVVKDFGDLKYGNASLADKAKTDLFELRNLSVGKPAPEIVGADVDGKPMKLSDFRGKVVVLDFFGFW